MDFDAIFDGKQPAISPVEQPAEPPPAIEAETPPEQPPEAPPEPVTPQEPQERTAPLTALLDERDKRKAAERRVAEMEAQQRQHAPQDAPDPYDDPDGYRAFEERQRNDAILSLRFEMSEAMARDKHGEDVVTAAMEWGAQRAQSDDAFRGDFLKQKNPIDWVVRQQKRDSLLADVGEDPDAYVRRRAAELGLIAAPDAGAGITPAPGQQQASKPATPPRSIASSSSAGAGQRDIATGPMAALDAVFKG